MCIIFQFSIVDLYGIIGTLHSIYFNTRSKNHVSPHATSQTLLFQKLQCIIFDSVQRFYFQYFCL